MKYLSMYKSVQHNLLFYLGLSTSKKIGHQLIINGEKKNHVKIVNINCLFSLTNADFCY